MNDEYDFAGCTDGFGSNPHGRKSGLDSSLGRAEMNLWDMACKGGWIMAVLAVLSVACFYIFFERLPYIHKAGKEDPLFMERIRDYICSGEVKSAVNYCRITDTPSARIIEKGISRMERPLASGWEGSPVGDAARRPRFNSVDGVSNQTGTITYYFKLK